MLVACRQDDPPAPTEVAGPADGTPEPASDVGVPPAADVTPTPEATPTITPTPIPPKDLVVCMSAEPADLYLYGDNSIHAAAVRHALYESLYTTLGYEYQPLALEKAPSLADGDARLEPVDVAAGDVVVNADGELGPLGLGMEVVDAAGQTVLFEGQPLQMARLVVEFAFRPLVWSDGEPVTAEDSVFSFHVAGDRGTPHIDDRVRFTAGYEATGERAVRWTGVPGYRPQDYMAHVWTPLPEHQLGDYTPAELAALEETTRAPLSYGAFVVAEWTPGESIRLTPNPNYYRADEGLPRLTSLTFRFLSAVEAELPEGYEACHILTGDLLINAQPALEATAATGALVEHVAGAGIVEQIIFGIQPTTGRVAWFQDARVRQAVTQCVDRPAIVDELTFGRAQAMDTFVPTDHVLHPGDLPQWPYDPAAGNALLNEAGYLDSDGDGLRNDVASTAPFTVTLGTYADSALRQQINEMAREDLAECGIQAETYTHEAGLWFGPGPSGTIFGRNFDLAAFAWLRHIQPDCEQYLTANIPGPVDLGFNGWEGSNVSGFANEAFDAACGRALSLLPGQEGYAEAHQEAMRIFAQELPAMPLFEHVRLAATTPDVLNFHLDSAQPSELWNVFELDLALNGQ
jgi:peptide/nickel transport system substrate-binding protein